MGKSASFSRVRRWVGLPPTDRIGSEPGLDRRDPMVLDGTGQPVEPNADELAALVHTAPGMVLTLSPSGAVRWMNRAGRALMGFAPDEDVTGYRIADLVSDEQRTLVEYENVPLVARDGRWSGRWTLVSRDGTHIPVTVDQHVHRDALGNPSFVSVIARDARPSLEEAQNLRESERRLAEAEEVAGLGSWEWNVQTGVLSWSMGMYRVMGKDPETFVPTIEEAFEVIHPDDRGEMQSAFEQDVARGGGVVEYRGRAVHADGTVRHIHCHGRIEQDRNGQPLRMLGTALDVTDWHLADQAVRASEARARAILATASEAYIEFDRDGRITDWNTQAETTFGWTREEAIGRFLPTLVLVPDDRCHLDAVIATEPDVADGAATDRVELHAVDRTGREFPIEFTAWPVQTARGAGWGSFTRDISERRAAENAKSEFVSVVSHELRTPLTSIHGALGLLRAGMLGELTDRGQRMVDIAATNTDRLVRLINDILDIERLGSGQVSLQRELCDGAVLAQRSAETMASLAERAGVRLVVDAQPAAIWADPDRIEQTLTNLLSNAIKFSPAGGTVSVTARSDERVLTISVRDQGRGIPADQLETVFRRFEQVDASDAREKGGTGLGLAICRTIVEQHSGTIWAESEPGEGSTFTLTLPLSRVGATAEDSVPGRRTILVCDDDPSVREVVMTLLETHGYATAGVGSGVEVIEAAIAHRPAAIILDLLMPEVDGWQAAAALRAHPETRDIPVVILSVIEPDSGQPPPGVDGWLSKPIDADVLLAEMHKQIDRSTAPKLLLVEDDLDLADVLAERFERLGVEVHHAATARDAVALCLDLRPDLLVLDLLLPDEDGYAVVTDLRRHDTLRGLPVAVYTACDLSPTERDRLRLGETQFFTKSRVSAEEFEGHVVRLLDHLTSPTEDHARA